MKNSEKQIKAFVQKIVTALKDQNQISFKQNEEAAVRRGVQLIQEDFAKEALLDAEVNEMMDDLERQNPGSFQRYKMFPLLKKKLAAQKGIVL